jgi:hypothetical protein
MNLFITFFEVKATSMSFISLVLLFPDSNLTSQFLVMFNLIMFEL